MPHTRDSAVGDDDTPMEEQRLEQRILEDIAHEHVLAVLVSRGVAVVEAPEFDGAARPSAARAS